MDSDQRDLLLSLAFSYVACDRARRALPLLLLVAAACPSDQDALRALAHVQTEVGSAALALATLDRLAALGSGDDPDVMLLRSRALHAAGHVREAQACFRDRLHRLHPSEVAA